MTVYLRNPEPDELPEHLVCIQVGCIAQGQPIEKFGRHCDYCGAAMWDVDGPWARPL